MAMIPSAKVDGPHGRFDRYKYFSSSRSLFLSPSSFLHTYLSDSIMMVLHVIGSHRSMEA